MYVMCFLKCESIFIILQEAKRTPHLRGKSLAVRLQYSYRLEDLGKAPRENLNY